MWNPVVRGTYIPADIETSYLHLRTYSIAGSGDLTSIWYYNEDKIESGGIVILFTSPVRYGLLYCQGYYTLFPTSPPVEDTKHWIIQRHGYRTVIFCNGELVLNITASTNTCDLADTWDTHWGRVQESILFPSYDAASDSFHIGWLLGS